MLQLPRLPLAGCSSGESRGGRVDSVRWVNAASPSTSPPELLRPRPTGIPTAPLPVLLRASPSRTALSSARPCPSLPSARCAAPCSTPHSPVCEGDEQQQAESREGGGSLSVTSLLVLKRSSRKKSEQGERARRE